MQSVRSRPGRAEASSAAPPSRSGSARALRSKPNQKIEDLKIELKNSKIDRDKNLISYVVQKGDTLYSISKRFNLEIKDLKEKNNLVENALSIGQQLEIYQ